MGIWGLTVHRCQIEATCQNTDAPCRTRAFLWEFTCWEGRHCFPLRPQLRLGERERQIDRTGLIEEAP